jgi:hypothetical protein
LINEERDAQFSSMYLFLFLTLCMFRAHRAHHQERQIVSTQPLVTVILKIDGESKLQNYISKSLRYRYTEKNCASRWSFTKNHYMMHGQQNLKFRTGSVL